MASHVQALQRYLVRKFGGGQHVGYVDILVVAPLDGGS